MDQQPIRAASAAILQSLPPGHGFILVTFPFNVKTQATVATNTTREDTLAVLQAVLSKAGKAPAGAAHRN